MKLVLTLHIAIQLLVMNDAALGFSSVTLKKSRFSTLRKQAVGDDIVAESIGNIGTGIKTEQISSASDESLKQYQDLAAPIVKSFVPKEYSPVPLFSNNHFQTIGGFFLRKSLPELNYVKKDAWVSSVFHAVWNNLRREEKSSADFWEERERVETPDGDWFHADFKSTDEKSKGLVVILHGLESNSESSLSIEMARAYNQVGMDVVCLNFRGCSGIPNDTLGGYHLGFTDDLKYYLSLLKSRNGSAIPPIFLSGFSLGANVVLKALGELGERAATEFNIRGAAVSCAPLDQEYHYLKVNAPGFNRQVYAENLLKTMKQRCQQQLDTFCNGDESTDQFDYRRAMEATDIAQFEDAFIAPVYGFDSNIDYYQKTSSIYFLEGIAVPTLIVNSRDDPFFDPIVWPIEKSCENGGRAPIKMVRTEQGGHLGFSFHQVSDEDEFSSLDYLTPSWCSVELSRFIQHVDYKFSA